MKQPKFRTEGFTPTDCEKCLIEDDMFIRLCPIHKAAPELLAACEKAFERLTDNDMMQIGSFGLTKILEAAISKAKGGENGDLNKIHWASRTGFG